MRLYIFGGVARLGLKSTARWGQIIKRAKLAMTIVHVRIHVCIRSPCDMFRAPDASRIFFTASTVYFHIYDKFSEARMQPTAIHIMVDETRVDMYVYDSKAYCSTDSPEN
jgi:hypothetical protein